MKSKFSQERRDVLKGACALAGATAVVTVSGSLPAFAVAQQGVPQVGDVFVFTAGPKKGNVVMVADIPVDDNLLVTVQAKDPNGAIREGDNCTAVLYRVSPDKVPEDIKSETVEGIIAYSAVCTHQGCMMDATHKTEEAVPAFGIYCPCHDAIFDPLKNGKNTFGATSRTLPHFPIKSDGGKIVVSDVPSGYVGVKRPG
jgi:rieske iron-sulfur protein